MAGIELAEEYFELYGRKMLEEEFPELLPYIAAGICGSGSDCFGYDDEVSRDHDMEPGFCLFLPGEEVVDRRKAFLLERAYSKLPKEYKGLKRSLLAPVGGSRKGVLRTAEFFQEKCGSSDGYLTLTQWLQVPEYALAEAVNGKIFLDNYGEVTKIRERLSFYPEAVALKKLAGNLLIMAQAGQYNYPRCLQHQETAAAQLAVNEFVRSSLNVLFLLNHTYQPYYKWSFRALRALPKLSYEAELLEFLLISDNEGSAEEKQKVIEGIAADVIDELIDSGLTSASCGDLEKHAYSVNDHIKDGDVRNLHILAAYREV
ncbi:MAG: DUF4037 domain-containing protein [Erysipelotrichaceae bacterium]|nr:DUF4037 domain-containing protein [Erysipelotrichaceae bacterium]